MSMSDDPEPTGSEGLEGPSAVRSAPGGTEAERGRELRKGDEEDRVLAGVCSGLGRYTEVDPVVWRTSFVLTAFAGAAGLLLYIAAWMLMRDSRGGPGTFEQMLNRAIPPRTVPKLLAVGLAVATAFSLVGGLGWSTLVLAVPLVLGLLTARNRGVDLRGAFTRLREDLRSKEPPPTTPAPGPTPTYYNPAQPWASAPHGPVDLAVVSERAAAQEGDTEDDGGSPAPGEGGREPGRDRRGGTPLASLALWTVVAGTLLVPVSVFGVSSTLWSSRTADLLFGPQTGAFFLSGVLAVIGVYALVGAWVGNPRGLMCLGSAAALLLVLASVTDLTQVRLGAQTWRPATVAEAAAGDHRLTVGSGTVDLTGLEDLGPGRSADVSLEVGVGRVELILPEDARVAVTSRVGLGLVDLDPADGEVDMVGTSLRYEEVHEPAAAAGAPTINVHTDSWVGVVEVQRGQA